jgi:hypothetical protein
MHSQSAIVVFPRRALATAATRTSTPTAPAIKVDGAQKRGPLLKPVPRTCPYPSLMARRDELTVANKLTVNAMYHVPSAFLKTVLHSSRQLPCLLLPRYGSAKSGREEDDQRLGAMNLPVLFTNGHLNLWSQVEISKQILVDGIAGIGKSLAMLSVLALYRAQYPERPVWYIPNAHQWLTGAHAYEPATPNNQNRCLYEQPTLTLQLVQSLHDWNAHSKADIIEHVKLKLPKWTSGQETLTGAVFERDVLARFLDEPDALLAVDGVNAITETVPTQYLHPQDDNACLGNDCFLLVRAVRAAILSDLPRKAKIVGVTHRSDPLFPDKPPSIADYNVHWKPFTLTETDGYLRAHRSSDIDATTTSMAQFVTGGRGRLLQEHWLPSRLLYH